jgi:hypothetical protein
LYDTEFSVRLDEKVKRIFLAETGEDIPFIRSAAGLYCFTLDKFSCHGMIVFDLQ